MVKYLYACALLCLVNTTVFLHAQKPAPKIVLFDTDIGNDIDDVLALAMLYHYQKQGLIDLRAITISKAYPGAVLYVDMLNKYYQLPFIPIGYVGNNGITPDPGGYIPQTLTYKKNDSLLFFTDSTVLKRTTEAFKLQRKVLAACPDSSAIFIVVGFSTNIARLLNSPPDEFSSLNGTALVERKVSKLYLMAGSFGERPIAEYNILEDIQSAQLVFSKWPTPVYTSGFEIGHALQFPSKALLDGFKEYWHHPVVNSYFHYMKMPYDRETWDLTAVMQAVFPDSNYFDYSPPGKITVDNKGFSKYKPLKNGRHYYFTFNQHKKKEVIRKMVFDVTGKR